ncbi:hypothetical protein BJY01DRAFT_216248 [Aspergillus pseudoustus]|uniref:ABM domain-containing protein n=1 Tax=Aspergillus pseudoustus TaxID=1810923 RepID=A0ABR4JSW7_9EURO
MPVRELACLQLKNNQPLTSPTNAAVLTKLRAGLKEQARYTNAAAHVLTQIEDPSIFYILGKWESVSQHVEEWIPSETNRAIMGGLAGDVELVWLQHLELNASAIATKSNERRDGEAEEDEILLAADVVAIGRYFILPEKKEAFERTFDETKHHLEAFNGGKGTWGAWREDRDVCAGGGVQEEFVLFSGWTDVNEHHRFAESEGFKQFVRIKEFLTGAEIKHARLLVSEHP